MQSLSIVSSVMSSLGWLDHCDSYHLSQKLVYANPAINEIMESASRELNIKNPLENVSW